MNAALSPTLLLQVLIIFQCLLFAGFLLVRRRPGGANVHLGLLLLLLAIRLGALVFEQAGVIATRLTPVDAIALLFGPLIAGHVRSLTFDERTATRDLVHFLPFLTAIGGIVSRLVGPTGLALAIFVSLAGYLIASAAMVARYRRVVASTRSERRASVSWLQFAIAGLFAVLVLDIVSFLVGRSTTSRDTAAAFVLFIVLLGYVTAFSMIALRRPELFAPLTPAELDLATETLPRPAELSAEDRDELARIDELMRSQRLFLRPDTTLADVASAASMPPRQLSSLINRGHERTFSDWVNGYRIEEAKRLLSAGDDATIVQVLHASGFQSKSTFNAVFRQLVGATPTQYRAVAASARQRPVKSS